MHDILGIVPVSYDFIKWYLEYFQYYDSKRQDLLFTEESLKGMYDIYGKEYSDYIAPMVTKYHKHLMNMNKVNQKILNIIQVLVN